MRVAPQGAVTVLAVGGNNDGGGLMGTAGRGTWAAARAAVDLVADEELIGIGTGSTVACFVEALAATSIRPSRAVSTSEDTDARLRAIDLEIVDLHAVDLPIGVYVDSADEIDDRGCAIKGGGGAHTREKLVARSSRTWICIVDESKRVERLGTRTPVPLDTEIGQLGAVIETVEALGACVTVRPNQRAGSDSAIADVHGLDLANPARLEEELESIPGVIAAGIFARRRADLILVGHADGSVTRLVPGQQETGT